MDMKIRSSFTAKFDALSIWQENTGTRTSYNSGVTYYKIQVITSNFFGLLAKLHAGHKTLEFGLLFEYFRLFPQRLGKPLAGGVSEPVMWNLSENFRLSEHSVLLWYCCICWFHICITTRATSCCFMFFIKSILNQTEIEWINITCSYYSIFSVSINLKIYKQKPMKIART